MMSGVNAKLRGGGRRGEGRGVELRDDTIKNIRLRMKALWSRNATCEKSSRVVGDKTSGAGARYTI